MKRVLVKFMLAVMTLLFVATAWGNIPETIPRQPSNKPTHVYLLGECIYEGSHYRCMKVEYTTASYVVVYTNDGDIMYILQNQSFGPPIQIWP